MMCAASLLGHPVCSLYDLERRIKICIVLIATLLLAKALSCSSAKNTKREEEDILLYNAVVAAQEESVHGRVELPQQTNTTLSPDTVRVLTGETAVFRCHHCDPHKLVWRHQNHLINGTAPDEMVRPIGATAEVSLASKRSFSDCERGHVGHLPDEDVGRAQFRLQRKVFNRTTLAIAARTQALHDTGRKA
ncbi:uncharacterized protein LOC129602871 [Paramacrobiotus metropolitanus]|uniref:uncharacterized protein LOC129602871 n=1 Tax=Paramacrobiotus metropolitanus TaxID=2943436 RepID=UPI0024463BD2|nr:uncharacterized protein LOC129602871 [Paramacrobiotus metropolitanus]